MEEVKLTNLYYKMNRTILQMMRDRKFQLDESEIDWTIEDFKKAYGSANFNPSSLNRIFTNDEGERIYACFDSIDKLSTATINGLSKKMDEQNVTHMIFLVRPGSATKASMKIVDGLRASGKWIEVFDFDEVAINITEHELVPKHEPLTEEEKQEVLKRYNVKETQLPRILRTDPVARYLGVRPGQILKITRKSDTAGEYVTYRLVY